MSVIFSDNFDDGNVNDWYLVPVSTGFHQIGCGGSKALTCGGNQSLGPRYQFPVDYTQGSFRFDYAYFQTGPAPDVGYLLTIYTYNASYYLMESLVYPDGHIQISSQTGSLNMHSPAGLIPSNGTWVAIQVTARFYLVSTLVRADFQFIVNNVVVWNPTNVIIGSTQGGSAIPANWDGFSLLGRLTVHTSNYSVVAYDNLQVDDVAAAITRNVCVASPSALFNGICSYVPPPDLSGLYVKSPSELKHDRYYKADKKIPDPTIKTAIVGE